MTIFGHSASPSCMLHAPPIIPSLIFMEVYVSESIRLELTGHLYGSLITAARACPVYLSHSRTTWIMLTSATQRHPLTCLWFWPVKCNWYIQIIFYARTYWDLKQGWQSNPKNQDIIKLLTDLCSISFKGRLNFVVIWYSVGAKAQAVDADT
jgi:hypothetical protein